MANKEKFIDRSPCIKPAGIASSGGNETVGECLVHEVTEEEGRPFVCKTAPLEYPLPPARTIIYKGYYSDVRECLQPEVDQRVFDVLTREFQETVYDSYWKKPLGRVADATPMLPAGMEAQQVCFGIKTPKGITAGELVNPPKSYVDVMMDASVGHEMYKKTHNDYDPGEQSHRNYIEPFRSELIWGKPTPSDPQGGCMKKVTESEVNDKTIVSKILAEHRKQTKPLVGKVLAPNGNIDCVPEGHAFGKLNKREMFGVGELLKESPPSLDKVDLYEEMAHINSVRQLLVKRNTSNLHRGLVDALHQVDVNNTGCLPLEDVYEVLTEFQINLDKRLFEALLSRLKILSNNGMVAYERVVDLLDVNIAFPDITEVKDVPKEFLKFETTNQIAHKYHCEEHVDTDTMKAAGVPPEGQVSIRSLVSPSVYSNYGLKPRDFFVSRSKEYIRKLLLKIGCMLKEEIFQKVWDSAADKEGCVSVHSFFNALKAN